MATIAAVTFDFHNTLVTGERWLHLEIHTLPCAVLEHLVGEGTLPPAAAAPAVLAQAEATYRAIREEAKASGSEVTAQAGVVRVFATLGPLGAVDGPRLAAALAAVQQACLADTTLIPGAHEVLAALRQAGRHLAVVSSAAYAPFVHWALARHGLAGYFPVVATSAETGYYKSDPRLYAWALDQLQVAPRQAVHVGDHARFDILGAQAAGMRAILFAPAGGPDAPGRPGDCRPDAVVADLRDIPAALAQLEQAPDRRA
ncbi:MAG TPA: HAD family hydrolase [Chloroflexia bacterium]|nr:HAD family hydrolase [Chloroflexia bacterium]